MTGRKINLGKSFRLDKKGNLVRNQANLPVNVRLQQAASKKIRVNRGSK